MYILPISECTTGTKSVCNELKMVIRKRVTFVGVLTLGLTEITLPLIILKPISRNAKYLKSAIVRSYASFS